MDFQPLIPWLSAIALIISIGVSVTTFLTAGAKRNSSTLINHESRIQKLENEMGHMPDRKMVHDLQLTLKDIQIEMASMKVATEQSTLTSRRVEEYLLNAGSRAA